MWICSRLNIFSGFGAVLLGLAQTLTIVLWVAFLLGCGGKKAPAPSSATAPTARPYTVLGQTYHPLTSAEGYTEEGIASWYGPQFHAKRTASGEIYNMYDLTAAHRILPMHTKIRVTNLKNNKSVTLRVNDRGPFAKNRVVDLSYAAAKELGVVRPGTARVRVEAIGRWPGGVPGRFFVQIGAFSIRENAEKTQREIRASGYPGTRIVHADVNGRSFWRVQVGEYTTLDQARKALASLAHNNPSSFVIAD